MTADFFLPPGAVDADIAILAKKGSGKTYTAKGIVERLIREGHRVLIFDPVSVWWGLKVSSDGKKPGLPVAVFGGPHADMPLTEGMGRPLARILARENLPSVIDFGDMPKAAWQRLVADMLDGLYRANREALTVVLEEADTFAPQVPREGDSTRVLGEVDRIARRGRAFGFRLITITQRPSRLHKDVLTQLSTLIALRMSAPHDLAAVKDWIDANAERGDTKAVIDALPKLKPGEGFVYSPDFNILRREVFPRITTLDTSATPKAGETRITPKVFAEVDLTELRQALEEETPAPKREKAAPDTKALEDARKEGFAEGWHKGTLAAVDAARRAIKLAHDALEAPPLEAPPLEASAFEGVDRPAPAVFDKFAVRPQMAKSLPLMRDIASSERVARPARMDLPNRIVEAAAAIYPVRLTFPALMATVGRKARGGHFNTEKKAALAAGLIREEGGFVILANPPAALEGADQVELLRERLPAGARELFAVIADHPGKRLDDYAAMLGRQSRGGYWNTSCAILRQNDLIEERPHGVFISERLKAGRVAAE